MVLQAEVGTIAPPMTKWLSSILYSGGCILTNGTGTSAHLHPWRQHQGLEALCSAQSQDAAEGDEERGT